jgi:hypothetical protein
LPALEEILPGLHRWTATLSDWTPDQGGAEGWGPEVACVAWRGEGALVLIDPLIPEGEWEAIDEIVQRHGGPVALVVTCPWHVRSAGEVIERYVNSPGIEVWADERAVEDRKRVDFEVDQVVSSAAAVAPGVQALTTDSANGEISVWIDPIETLVAADVLLGAEGERAETLRVCPQAWLDGDDGGGNDVETVKAALRPLLDRDIRAIVPLHGDPVLDGAHKALSRALS